MSTARLLTAAVLLLALAGPGRAAPPAAPQAARAAAQRRARADALAAAFDYAAAIPEYRAAYRLDRAARPDDAAEDLNNLGIAYDGLSRFAEARDCFRQALPLFRRAGDRDGQADALLGLGVAARDLSRFAEAVGCDRQALALFRQAGDVHAAAMTLGDLGVTYGDLGDYPRAIAFYRQALPLFRQAGDREAEAKTLGNLGVACDDRGAYAAAADYFQQALVLQQLAGDRRGQARTYGNLGIAGNGQGQYSAAIGFFEQALALQRQAGDEADGARTLTNIGVSWDGLGQPARAMDEYRQALPLYRQAGDRTGAAKDLANLMLGWQALGQPRPAIFYGKEAVNAYQTIRVGLGTLDRQTRAGYLASIAHTYRALADLLIGEGRLPEAEQVLKRLKEREFYDFLNPAPGAPAPTPEPIALTPRERRWAGRDADAALAEDFRGPATADDALPRTAGAQDLAQSLPPGSAAVYTIVAPDRLYLIVVAPGRPAVARSSPITADALYQKVYAFRQALRDPGVDPRPLAAALYRLALGPVQADLDAAHATTLLFSLDDALRYVPPAALYDPDTQHYVAQDYATALITLAGQTPPAAPDAPGPLTVLGAGVSASQDGLAPLPGVRQELDALVHEPRDAGGLIPGRKLLDGGFTQAALLAGLAHGYPLVHLASHFALHPTDADSFLLLGDGARLSVADIARDPHRFRGVDLLTLSACDTDMEIRSSTGREVEGFGALAQTLGARSVLASLWPVSDAATPPWMAAFYGYAKGHPQAPLSEAVRQAQLSLLTGAAPARPAGSRPARGTALDNPASDPSLPPFTPDPKAPYAHPYYWAPFVLIGNWW